MRKVSLKSLLQSCFKYVPIDLGRWFFFGGEGGGLVAYTILPLDIGVIHIPFTLGCLAHFIACSITCVYVFVFLFTYLFKFCF